MLNPGPPPLRHGADRIGTTLALHILKEASGLGIFAWVEKQNLGTGHINREASTIARGLELAVKDYGPAFLMSPAAEVMLRRLFALVIASKAGATKEAWRMASRLEDLASDGIGGTLPTTIQAKLQAEMKAELQLEALMAGRLPGRSTA